MFLDFVLSRYVSVGVDELGKTKPTPLLRLTDHDSMSDAVADLGIPNEISLMFRGGAEVSMPFGGAYQSQ